MQVENSALARAREYETKQQKLRDAAVFPIFHLRSPAGWINDPNGFSLYEGEYHLFFQYHPYSAEWGPMHWGHAKTRDFVQWEYLPAAMAPDQDYDCEGCFSGSAIQDGDRHILAYTSVCFEKQEDGRTKVCQTQSIAAGDGYNYSKQNGNPVIGAGQLPAGSDPENFRDPKLWKENDIYYIIAGSQDRDKTGRILKYASRDLIHWTFEGILFRTTEKIGRMWECPDYFKLRDKQVLLISPQDMQAKGLEYHCGNGSVYFTGYEENGAFIEESRGCMDFGTDFYAPQTLLTGDGRRIMIAWMQSWDIQNYPPEFEWSGMMTFPRELSLQGHTIRQAPAREIEQFRKNKVRYDNFCLKEKTCFADIRGRVIDLTVQIKKINCSSVEIRLAKGGGHYISIEYDAAKKTIIFDRKYAQCIRDIVNERKLNLNPDRDTVTMRILMDLYSVEIFFNEGEKTLTSLFFMDLQHDDIEFIPYGGSCVLDIEKWDIKI